MSNPHGKGGPAVEGGQLPVLRVDGAPSHRQLGRRPRSICHQGASLFQLWDVTMDPEHPQYAPWPMYREALTRRTAHSHEVLREFTGETDRAWPRILDATWAEAEGSLPPVGPVGLPGEGTSGELFER